MRFTTLTTYWLSRLLTVVISTTGYLFLLLSTQQVVSVKQFASILLGLILFGAIVYQSYRLKKNTIIAYSPVGILTGFWVYFFLGGFVSTFTFVTLLFTSLLISLLVALSAYSWTSNVSGGITYISLGVFYFLISFARVPLQTLTVVAGIIVTTGILLTISPPPARQSTEPPTT